MALDNKMAAARVNDAAGLLVCGTCAAVHEMEDSDSDFHSSSLSTTSVSFQDPYIFKFLLITF